MSWYPPYDQPPVPPNGYPSQAQNDMVHSYYRYNPPRAPFPSTGAPQYNPPAGTGYVNPNGQYPQYGQQNRQTQTQGAMAFPPTQQAPAQPQPVQRPRRFGYGEPPRQGQPQGGYYQRPQGGSSWQ